MNEVEQLREARKVFDELKEKIDKITEEAVEKTNINTVKIMLRAINIFWSGSLENTFSQLEEYIKKEME